MKRLAAITIGLTAALAAPIWALTPSPQKAEYATPAAAAASAVIYSLGPRSRVQALYPDASWLPKQYKDLYPDLATTIGKYTQQSLKRDGVPDATVNVTFVGEGDPQVQVSIVPDNAITRRYAKLHPAFLGSKTGQAALKAVQACQHDASDPRCWQEPDPPKYDQPWAFYLPLGMSLAKAPMVMFMDYPPAASLKQGDYLLNFTLCRWNQVLGAAGMAHPDRTNVIVDARPIAAPGAGMDALMPYPPDWFNSPKGAVYLTPMLQQMTTPQAIRAPAGRTLPVAVFGSKPRETWAALIGRKNLKVLSVGESALGGQARKTSWITTNHPDVTTYNCCPGDPSSNCKGADSANLVGSEQTDFVAACWIKAMAVAHPPTAQQAKDRCTAVWVTHASAQNKQSLCVQAKYDNQNKAARCPSYGAAWNYCAANNGNACASYDCNYDAAKATLPLPPVAKRPFGSEKNCSTF